jgi:hypothetical protein
MQAYESGIRSMNMRGRPEPGSTAGTHVPSGDALALRGRVPQEPDAEVAPARELSERDPRLAPERPFADVQDFSPSITDVV